MKADDPILIDFIKNNVLIKPDNLPLKLDNRKPNEYEKMGGQFNQPFEVEKILGLQTSKKINEVQGFFIEAGAAGGELLSNTLYFETKYGWTGLLVEPNPKLLKLLYSKHRNSYILPHCLSTKPEVEVVTFEINDFIGKILVKGRQRSKEHKTEVF